MDGLRRKRCSLSLSPPSISPGARQYTRTRMLRSTGDGLPHCKTGCMSGCLGPRNASHDRRIGQRDSELLADDLHRRLHRLGPGNPEDSKNFPKWSPRASPANTLHVPLRCKPSPVTLRRLFACVCTDVLAPFTWTYPEISFSVAATKARSYSPAVPLHPPVSVPPKGILLQAVDEIKKAKQPLLIVGKGCAWSERGPSQLTQFVTSTGLPYLATPGGKGVISDLNPQSVAPARSMALREADVIILAGARLNWILHFGLPPRFNKNVKIIQIDLCPEEFHQNVATTVPLFGDIGETVELLRCELDDFHFDKNSEWFKRLIANSDKNRAVVQRMTDDHTLPLNYYAAYDPIREFILKNDVVIVNEGANTMDIGRTMMPNVIPRRRLDAGTFGTMGVGLGYALAAGFYCRDHSPNTKVLVVQGDSAFGFSGMEIETIVRYELPIVIVVINNSGIYRGIGLEDWKMIEGDKTTNIPVLSLSPECRYEKMCKALGGRGILAHSVPEIRNALNEAFKYKTGPTLINTIIATDSERKSQEYNWLTRSKV
ncbi:hypothetical protein L596_002392 [Steinernema carpocapsae]|uniref:2-hydroxyacyl-CoA lyase n=1 Tax=Steinernema carpocapsae TaxID=34508 RepID=A0A4U8UPD9_STECR|nr:hypothetical protein L596_002392 [Steinernema carpocapsae]